MVNRGDLVRMTANQAHVPIATTDKVLTALIECLIVALAAGESVHIKRLGNFELRNRQPVMRLNPRTGDQMPIGARVHVSFLAGDTLKNRLNP